jgi:hypothetical protein
VPQDPRHYLTLAMRRYQHVMYLCANFASVSYLDFLSSLNIWFDVLMKSYAVVAAVIDKYALAGSRYFRFAD